MNEVALEHSIVNSSSAPVDAGPPKDRVLPSAGVFPLEDWGELPDMSGIYCLLNIKTGKPYVGSGGGRTSSVKVRCSQHYRMFLNRNHYNGKLRNSVNKHGDATWGCLVLELCGNDVEILTEREDFWIRNWTRLVVGTILLLMPIL